MCPEEVIYHSIKLNPAVTEVFYCLSVLPQTELLTFFLMCVNLKRLHQKQCKFYIKLQGLHIEKEKERRIKEDCKESNLVSTQHQGSWLYLPQKLSTGIILFTQKMKLSLPHTYSLFFSFPNTPIFTQSFLLQVSSNYNWIVLQVLEEPFVKAIPEYRGPI